jgi:hypothetical protein
MSRIFSEKARPSISLPPIFELQDFLTANVLAKPQGSRAKV